jgi:hypothetical protein
MSNCRAAWPTLISGSRAVALGVNERMAFGFAVFGSASGWEFFAVCE